MKYLRKFDSLADLNTAIQGSSISFMGLAYNNGTPVVGNKVVPPTPPAPTHGYVEIGGIKWATMNVGASTIYDYGLYFQWGDIQGYTAGQVGWGSGQKAFTWDDYKFNPSHDGQTFTKYNSTDGKTTLDLEDDAVHTAWGGNWRIPTANEFQTLGNSVNAVWTTNYNGSGVNGLVCSDKTDNSKVLFFPASGWCSNESNSVVAIGEFGGFWSSSRYDISSAYEGATFNAYSEFEWCIDYLRCVGHPVRGVLDD